MRVPTMVLKVVTRVPALVVSFVLTLTLFALMPPALGLPGFVAVLVGLGLLACGLFADEAILVLTRSRPATPGERNVLAGALAQLAAVDLEVGTLLVRRAQRPATPAAEAIGTRTLVVAPGLVDGVFRGGVTAEEAAALMAHAIGARRGGPPRLEVAVLAATTPWRMVLAVAARIAAAFAWLPLMGAAWTLRGIVGVVCVVQSAVEGHLAAGLLGGLVIALTYAMPAANRELERRREHAADVFVASLGLGRVLAGMLRRWRWPTALERLQLLEAGVSSASAAVAPRLRLVQG